VLLNAINREIGFLSSLINSVGSVTQRQAMQKKIEELRGSLQCK
jgi:hypothetical protein